MLKLKYIFALIWGSLLSICNINKFAVQLTLLVVFTDRRQNTRKQQDDEERDVIETRLI